VVWTVLARDSLRKVAPNHMSTVLAVPDFWLLAMIYSVTFGGFVGLTSFMPIFLNSEYHVKAVDAGMITAAAAFLGSTFRPLGGVVSDRFTGRGTSMVILGIVLVTSLLVATHISIAVTSASFFVMLASLGCGNGAVFQMVPQRFPKEIDVVTGLVGAAGGLGGFVLPTMLGTLKDVTGTYFSGFAVFALMAGIALTIVTVAGRRWARTWLSRDAAHVEVVGIPVRRDAPSREAVA
ncbi:MAG: nitrate/nitrite transporter, partial [Candidatus Dormibacteria bacterium]